MTNLRTAYQLFLDSKWIQIRTVFYVSPSFIIVTGPTYFSPRFLSLSLTMAPYASLSLSLGHYRGESPFITPIHP
jgi:hypothetical protein